MNKEFKLSPEISEEVSDLDDATDVFVSEAYKKTVELEDLKLKASNNRKKMWRLIYKQYPELIDERCGLDASKGIVTINDKNALGDMLGDFSKFMKDQGSGGD